MPKINKISKGVKIFNGKKIAERILADLKKKISQEKAEPTLAIVLVGEDPASKLYIKRKKEEGKKVGIKVRVFRFNSKTKQSQIIEKIEKLNKNKNIHGLILQLPLPKGFDASEIIEAIDPKKDVDGFHRLNRQLLKKGKPFFWPVLPSAIWLALQRAGQSYRRKKVIALVNSDVFGESLGDFLIKKGIKIEYLLKKKIVFSKIKSSLKKADVVIVAIGWPNFIKKDMIKKGAVLIDAGISLIGPKKVRGDVDRKSVENKASFLTPVPGGLGPLVVALLLKNVYLAFKRQN